MIFLSTCSCNNVRTLQGDGQLLGTKERLYALLLHVLLAYGQRKLERMCVPEIEEADTFDVGAQGNINDEGRDQDQRERLRCAPVSIFISYKSFLHILG